MKSYSLHQKCEYTKLVIRIRKSKKFRQYKGQRERTKIQWSTKHNT